MYKELFNSISFGVMQSYKSVNAYPLISPVFPGALPYFTLVEAIEQMLLKIEEVSEGGSVPELRVVSKAKIPVLLVSGEEVKGAKQNRILNTSILIPAESSVIIPVSCTERGRWSYSSPDFKDSGNISSRDIRMAASDSVRLSLNDGRGHRSDQGKVWDKIEELHFKSRSDNTSRTRAMDDAYKSMADDLEEAQRHFSLISGQTGILFFHAGKVAGLDVFSRSGAYARLHGKLVKSYLIDCLGGKSSKYLPETLQQEARQFLDSAGTAAVKVFKSPGLGDDHRLQTQHVHGSVLVFENEPVHACCFRTEPEEDRMAGFNKRRNL